MPEDDFQKILREARKKDNSEKKAREMAKSVSNPVSATKKAFSLASQIRVSDLIFVLPLMLALLKDLSDLLLVGSLWGIGTIISICCSILGLLFIFLIGAGEANKKAKIMTGIIGRVLVLLGGTAVEAFIMGVNFLPVQTITFIIMYLMILNERAQNAEQEKSLSEGVLQYT